MYLDILPIFFQGHSGMLNIKFKKRRKKLPLHAIPTLGLNLNTDTHIKINSGTALPGEKST